MAPPPPPPPVPDRHRHRSGRGTGYRPWLIGAVVVLALVALYNFGVLDGLVDAVTSRSVQETAPAQTTNNAVTIQQPAEDPVAIPDDDPAAQGTVEAADQEDNQAGMEQRSSEEKTEVSSEISAEKPDITTRVQDEKPDVPATVPVEKPDTSPTVQDEKPEVPVTVPAEKEEIVQELASPEVMAPVTDASPEGAAAGEYFVHIYSFRTPERAESFVRHWEHPEDSLSIISQDVRGVTWHRIYLGPYEDQQKALMVGLRLKQNRTIDYFKVIQFSGDQ